MELKIIRANKSHIEDVSIIFDLYRQFYKYQKDLKNSKNYIHKMIKNNESIIFIATENEKIIAFVQLYETFDSLNLSKKLVLYDLYVLETFHGPTYTFKDFGARFLACYLEEYLKHKTNEKFNVLVSTSGDTGSAIASAFHKKKNIKVTILYPDKKISEVQEIQMTTYGDNITAVCIKNDFDQCQEFVKKAFVALPPELISNVAEA